MPERARKGALRSGVFRKAPRIMLAFALAASFALPLSSCKPTDVLTQRVVDQDAQEIDESLDPVMANIEDADVSADIMSAFLDESERIDDQVNDQPTYDQQAPEDGSTDQREHAEGVDDRDNATSGTESGEEEGSNQGGSSSGTLVADPMIPSGSGDGESSGTGSSFTVEEVPPSDGDGSGTSGQGQADDTTPAPGSDNTTGGDEGGGAGGTGSVYGADGTYTQLPHSGELGGVGQMALIVAMLCGGDNLAVADESWLSQMRSSCAFPGELDATVVGWSGDGTANGQADTQAIIDSGVEVLFVERNSGTLSTSDAETLQNAGIDIVYMPELGTVNTADNDIVTAVQVVGEVARQATDGSSSSMATQYVQMRNEALNNTVNANGGVSYKALGGMTYPYQYQGSSVNSGTGTASKVASYAAAFIDSWGFFSSSTVQGSQRYSNTTAGRWYQDGKTIDLSMGAGLSVNGNVQGFALMDYYLQCAGVMDTSFPGAAPSMAFSGESGDGYFIIKAFSPVSDDGSSGSMNPLFPARSLAAPTQGSLWFSISGSTDDSSWNLLGDAAVPAIITRNETYADQVVASSNSSSGSLCGFYDVGRPYQVWVMPSGVAGSWADGTVESYLVAPWAYCMYQSGKDLSVCTTYIDSFYSTFYRCSYQDAYDTGLIQGYGVVKNAGTGA